MAIILVISPTPSHPQNAGNRARIFALLSELQDLGHRVHFLYLEYPWQKSDIMAMEKQWDGFTRISWDRPKLSSHKRLYDFFAKIFGRKCLLPYGIDDWFDSSIIPQIQKLSVDVTPDIVIIEYVFLSKIFDYLDKRVLKILDTHDVFGGRDRLFLQNNLYPQWFYTSEEEEKKGVDRADIILAIQAQEAEYFKKISERKVLTVGHLAKPTTGGGNCDSVYPPRLLFVGSSNPSIIDGIGWFLENVFEILLEKKLGIELNIIGSVTERLEVEAGTCINLLGTVDNVTPFYMQSAVVINPLQFGTGLKIKTIEAITMQCPLVTTSIGAAGVENWSGRAFLCADTPREFAAAIFQIIYSKELRDNLRRGAAEFTAANTSKAILPLVKELDGML